MSNRRYKVNEFPIYDRTYYHAKINSPVLNRNALTSSSEGLRLWNEEGQMSLLRELEGNKHGQYLDNKGRMVDSQLKQAQDLIAAIDEQFQAHCDQVKRSGKNPPEEMPRDMAETKLRAEAKLDILKDEIEALKLLLARHKDRKKETDDDLVLKNGPKGVAMGADPPREVDGQPVKWDGELGAFVINCPKSPYHKMRLPDYYAFVVKPFNEARVKAHRAAHKRCNDLTLNDAERQAAWEKGNMILKNKGKKFWPERPEET